MTVENEKNYRRPRSFFGPILLIVIGLLFLAKNLDFIPGGGWSTIWRLWPVLLIVAGADDLIRREGVAWPILMIGAGVFLLLNYFGPRVWISWTHVAQLWPVILIAIGIDLVFKRESGWMAMIGILLTIALVGGAVWVAFQGYQVAADYSAVRESYEAGAAYLDMDLSLRMGELILGSETDTGVLVQGNITPDEFQDHLEQTGKLVSYKLENNNPSFYPHTARWELDLTDMLGVNLMVDNGVGEVFLDLTGAELISLTVNQGVGRLVIYIPEVSSDEILIKQAVGTIQVQIPDNTRVAVDAQNGLSKVDFPSDFELEDGYYVSPGANQKNAELLIAVEQAIGLVTFQYAR